MAGSQVFSTRRIRAGVARIRRWIAGPDSPSREEARRRIRSRPGFLSSLSPEARAALLHHDGPELMGDPRAPRR